MNSKQNVKTLQNVECNAHSNHEENRFRIYMKKKLKSDLKQTFHYKKKSTKQKRKNNAEKEGQKNT